MRRIASTLLLLLSLPALSFAEFWRLQPARAEPFTTVEHNNAKYWQTPAGNAHRLAFDAPEDFPENTPAYVVIRNWENGVGDLNVRYDGAESELQMAEERFGFRQFDGEFERYAVFKLAEPNFEGRQESGADFGVEALLEDGGALAVRQVLLFDEPPAIYKSLTREPWLEPYRGESRSDIDTTALHGKILCGYQGWFNAPYDGTDLGFKHWTRDRYRLTSDTLTVDLWPDYSDYNPKNLYTTKYLKHANGEPAKIYSAFIRDNVLLHFKWMREHGIDGVFLSRFTIETIGPESRRHVNMVLNHIREGAHREGRTWAMMLDVSGPPMPTSAVIDDWKFLVDEARVADDERYLHHEGKPVVLLWGFGFPDREWSVEQAHEVIDFFKNDPKYGVYLIGGTPAYWRELKWDSREEKEWLDVYHSYHAISPWSAGRYHMNELDKFSQNVWAADLEYLGERGMGYMACAFPGFSWRNLTRTKPGEAYFAREKGEFLWRQFYLHQKLGVKTTFVGMFDEIDEGTAIFEATNNPPAGPFFVTHEGLPSDYYLQLTGAATKMRRGEIPLSEEIPDSVR